MSTENFIVNYYKSIPIVSRMLFTISMGLTLLTYLNIVSPYTLVYSLEYVKRLELWRVVTSFFYWGPMNIDVLVHQIFLLRYSIMLEDSFTNASDYFYMILTGMALIFAMSNFLKIPRMSPALSSFIMYVWAKKNPMIIVQYLGLISMPAYYIPYIMCIISYLLERRIPKGDLVGIVAGHVYFYFKTVYPRTSGKDPLGTPRFIHALFNSARPPQNLRERSRVATLDDIREHQD